MSHLKDIASIKVIKIEECENYPLFRLIFLLISSYIIICIDDGRILNIRFCIKDMM